MDEITESVLRSYKKFMENQDYAGKTIDTRLNIVYFLLKKNGNLVAAPEGRNAYGRRRSRGPVHG